jgi:hypothetical protein
MAASERIYKQLGLVNASEMLAIVRETIDDVCGDNDIDE